jgi:hypothetical protein
MKRRLFLKNTIYAGISGTVISGLSCSPVKAEQGEILYNGIRLPEIWPPENMNPNSYDPMPVPYLCNPPQVIPIDVGRQLFVDDFLIETTNLKREFHTAKKYEGNPVLKPDTELEKGVDGLPVACPKDGGVWWDPNHNIFKMWYEAGWIGSMAYATSKDGINWERPNLDIVPGTNQLLPGLPPDSTTVFLDHDTKNPEERFKMFLRGPNFLDEYHGFSLVSPDGIHWSEPVRTGYCGDRSTMFYNPFRKKWVYSVRSGGPLKSGSGRARYYHEHSDFLKGAEWKEEEIPFWTGADRLDPPDPAIGNKAQLYNLSAVGYESIMLGLHQIHLGPPNDECQKQGIPKITELMLSFSRDGFHWHRPNREAFISATRKPGDWDRGYVQSVGGICAIVGDQLWFYYIGFKGDPENLHPDGMKSGMYANGSTGIAILRRDGFASMAANKEGGTLVTRPVTFNGKFLFVNTDCRGGELRVEILNEDNTVINSFSADNCNPVLSDSTIQQVSWKNSKVLSSLTGKTIRFRFYLKNGHLYSFWVSPDASGSSQGYVAGGGPGLTGSKDEVGNLGYKPSQKLLLD